MRFLHKMGGTSEVAKPVNARPVVIKSLALLAARAMGPGPLRLKMVKLAHDLDAGHVRRVAV